MTDNTFTPVDEFDEYGDIIVGRHVGLGWLPDVPDLRDYDYDHPSVEPLSRKVFQATARRLPDKIDLRRWCSPVENQGRLNSCTAHAAAGIIEFFERRSYGKHIDVSRLFIYKTTRKLAGLRGDTGAYLRTTMAALRLFGAPPERYWPYTTDRSKFDKEPPAFCYAFAQNFQAIRYVRHDRPGVNPQTVLQNVKRYLAAGVPAMFGFAMYNTINNKKVTASGEIPMPIKGDRLLGGHAVVAVGYDDHKVIKHPRVPRYHTTGAFLIRNSWGAKWGQRGYGWLPYDYLLRRLAVDWWSLLKAEWVDLGKQFQL